MRNGVVLVTLLAWVAVASGADKTGQVERLVSWNFAGTQQLSELKEQKVLKEILALPETEALRKAAAQQLAQRAAGRFGRNGTNINSELARLVQPLLPDLWLNESRFEMVTRGAADADWILAVKLNSERAGQWSTAVAQLANRAGMKSVDPQEGAGWTMRKEEYSVSFWAGKGWMILEGGFAAGPERNKAFEDFRADLRKRRGKAVLDAEINTPLLGKIWSAPRLAEAPKFTLKVTPRNDGLRSEMVMEFARDLGFKPEKWNLPKELIREPLIGFTAVQGIETKLAKLPRLRAVGPQEIPNQLFIWAQGIGNFSVSFAAEVGNAEEVVQNVVRRVVPELKLPAGRFQVATNRAAVAWVGLPIIVPFLEAAPAPHSSFVTGGFFPVTPINTNTIPAELVEQLQKKNLVYYEWELTGERIQQWVPLWQLYYLVSGQKTPSNTSASPKWLQAVAPKLGNCITEVTMENSRKLKWVRQSLTGFNALETTLLAHWLDPEDLLSGPPRRNRSETPVAPLPGRR